MLSLISLALLSVYIENQKHLEWYIVFVLLLRAKSAAPQLMIDINDALL